MWDLERAIDDFVLLTMLIGNDFLAALPAFAVNAALLEQFVALYRRNLPKHGYVTDGATIHFARLARILQGVGPLEESTRVCMRMHMRACLGVEV